VHAVRGVSTLPWSRPRHELLLLLLVAAAALSPVYVVSSQDISRLCLSKALTAGRLTIGACAGHEVDQARYRGRTYSDKAPGMSVLAVPAAEAVGLPMPSRWRFGRDPRVWAVRVLTGGVAFVLLAFAVGRVSEGLRRTTGGAALVTFALATVVGAMAATTFDHVTAGALGFAAFLCAWGRRDRTAGLLAGGALVVEYQAAIIVAIVACYVALAGARPLLRYLLGVVPGALVLGAYDWAAFGSPLHPSYRYVANRYAAEQATGLFGISMPRWHSADLVLFADRGLLVASPVLLAALYGLVLLARRHPFEAVTCTAVFVAFLFLEFGYFLPYGGVSPGPRFLIPAIPFLALGLGPSFARRPLVTSLLAIASLIASTALALTWSWESTIGYRQTVWGELARLATGARSRLGHHLASNVMTWAGLSGSQPAIVVAVCSLAALVLAVRPLLGPGVRGALSDR
jgi:hypothetical protein